MKVVTVVAGTHVMEMCEFCAKLNIQAGIGKVARTFDACYPKGSRSNYNCYACRRELYKKEENKCPTM
jgi:hypothetical protein